MQNRKNFGALDLWKAYLHLGNKERKKSCVKAKYRDCQRSERRTKNTEGKEKARTEGGK